MTFQQLQYLLAIHDAGSVSLAAKELFISQSSLSIALASLENELGCRIFIRSTHGLTLTPEGKQVIGHARRICENHRLLTTSVKPSQPQFRLGAIEYAPARSAFLRLLDENRRQTDTSFAFCGIANYPNRLVRGEIDMAVNLSFSQYDDQHMEDAKKQKLLCQKLTSVPACIRIGEKHRLYHKKDLKPEDFADERLLEVPGRPISRTGLLMAYVPIDPENVLECNNLHLARQLREEGHVYAITHMRSKQLRDRETDRYIPIPGLRYSLFAYSDSIRPLSPEAIRYLELLQEESASAIL